MSSVSSGLDTPLSLFSIPVVWFTAFYPALWKTLALDFTTGYDNVQPRSNISNPRLHPEFAKRLERMMGAHNNGNETAPLWFAAVIAGNYAGLDHRWLNKMSTYYVVCRVLYNQVYINHPAVWKGKLRSSLFFISICCGPGINCDARYASAEIYSLLPSVQDKINVTRRFFTTLLCNIAADCAGGTRSLSWTATDVTHIQSNERLVDPSDIPLLKQTLTDDRNLR
ncbi:hypothetical protein BJ165DRAFT_1400858 [Panaeolus papilionaceus]|nr:hypothetical protein BJ165DRAFT_1400858 [Panaeolus papilionaceus]